LFSFYRVRSLCAFLFSLFLLVVLVVTATSRASCCVSTQSCGQFPRTQSALLCGLTVGFAFVVRLMHLHELKATELLSIEATSAAVVVVSSHFLIFLFAHLATFPINKVLS